MSWHTPPLDPARSRRVADVKGAAGSVRTALLADLAAELAFHLGISSSKNAALSPTLATGLTETLRFFILVVGLDPFEGRWFKYVTGIDFHRPVAMRDLFTGTVLVTFESRPAGAPKPFLYYAERGASPMRLGTNFRSYQYIEHEVVARVPTLSSYASGIRFDEYDMVSRPGGARQYIVPASCAGYIRQVRTGKLV